MKKRVQGQVGELARMGVRELQHKHQEMFGKPGPAHRQFLVRKIAWRMQADHEGGLPESARELARAIAKDAPLRSRVVTNVEKRRAGIAVDQVATTTINPNHDARLPNSPSKFAIRQLNSHLEFTIGQRPSSAQFQRRYNPRSRPSK
ncbi:MAG: DUF2924 domain-containing protein [Bryobacterales bacterium]|nr:DUF2924 domain-containing protein [Bryobacterales bacterium]